MKNIYVQLKRFIFIAKLLTLLNIIGKIDEKATQLHAIASLKVLLDATKSSNGISNRIAANNSNTDANELTLDLEESMQLPTSAITETTTGVEQILNGRMTIRQDASIELVFYKVFYRF
jgi:hypothetical protein